MCALWELRVALYCIATFNLYTAAQHTRSPIVYTHNTHSYLGRDIVQHASRGLTHCLAAVAPRILSWAQVGEVASAYLAHKLFGRGGE